MPNEMTREEAGKLKKILTQLGFEVPKEVTAKLAEPEEEMLCETCGCPVHPCSPCNEVVLLNDNHTDEEYCRLLRLILKEGRRKKNRTGVNTIGVFGAQAKFDVRMDAFPVLTTKKMFIKGIVHELLWFLRGDTNIKYLVDNGVHIWDEWAYATYKKQLATPFVEKKHQVQTQDEFINRIANDSEFASKYGDLGLGTYGGMWRAFPYAKYTGVSNWEEYHVDQIDKVIKKLQTNPDDRRMIVSAWHPYWVDHCALPPCHCLFHFNTEELTVSERHEIYSNHGSGDYRLLPKYLGTTDAEAHKAYDDSGVPRRRLNVLLYQRSCDIFLGVPFNITSYCLLLAMVAHCVGMEPGTFTHTYGDLHIYDNHLEQVKLQLSRTPKVLPRLILAPKKYGCGDISSYKYEDIILLDYTSHPAIKAPIAV